MDKYKFVEALKRFAHDNGAVVRVNLVNSNGSPMDGAKLESLDENILRNCRIASAIVIPTSVVAEVETIIDHEEGEH